MPVPAPYLDAERQPIKLLLLDFSALRDRDVAHDAMKEATRQLVGGTPDHGRSTWLEYRWPPGPLERPFVPGPTHSSKSQAEKDRGAAALHFTLPDSRVPRGEVDFGRVPAGALRAVRRGEAAWRLTLQLSATDLLVAKVVAAACLYELEPYDDHRAALFEAVRALSNSEGAAEFECPHCRREVTDPGDIFMCPCCGRHGCDVEGVGGCIPGGPGIACPACGGPDETSFEELR
jgi:hypothetical protein